MLELIDSSDQMVGTIFDSKVMIKRVTTLGYQPAQALNDPLRIKIIEILNHKQMTAEEISKVLRRSGHKKATTTVRHHLDILKNRGLIEVTKIVEVRGAVKKYYMPTVRAFSYNPPSLEKHTKLVEETSFRLIKVLKNILEDADFLTAVSGKEACNLCKGDHYKEYAALELLNEALAGSVQSKEWQSLLEGKNQPKK
ncbi:MAG: winged helix-turn-helix domain-containing protein [Thermoproteota archaeon]|nr:winged helix-turn-helix domain-containing protein [Thermoproteota archaeon]